MHTAFSCLFTHGAAVQSCLLQLIITRRQKWGGRGWGGCRNKSSIFMQKPAPVDYYFKEQNLVHVRTALHRLTQRNLYFYDWLWTFLLCGSATLFWPAAPPSWEPKTLNKLNMLRKISLLWNEIHAGEQVLDDSLVFSTSGLVGPEN